MGQAPRVSAWYALARLVGLVVLVSGAIGWSAAGAQPGPAGGCLGDEQVFLNPSTLHVGDPMLVAAISRFPHEAVRLSSPAGPLIAVHETTGDLHIWHAGTVTRSGWRAGIQL